MSMSMRKRMTIVGTGCLAWRLFLVLAIVSLVYGTKLMAANDGAKLVELSREFVNPPDSAKPQVYWFWLGGQVTREGITADLEAMYRAGIGGGLIMTMGGSIPGGPMRTIEPDFVDLVEHAAKESKRLGLSITLHNCSGWAGSGGPWIKPEQSMQELTYSEIKVTGGKSIIEKLPAPPARHGFYKDIAVLAFPTPGDEKEVVTPDNPVKLTTNARDVDVSGLAEGLPGGKMITFPWKAIGPFYVQAEFTKPVTLNAITIKSGTSLATGGNVMVSDDGVNFKPLIRFELKPVDPTGYAKINFEKPVTARVFRFPFNWSWLDLDVTIGHIRFLKSRLTPDMVVKAVSDQPHHATPDVAVMMQRGYTREVAPEALIRKGSLVELTSRMRADGVLEWEAPAGDWTIIRVGHTSTGRTNGGYWSGLECDKLDPDGIKAAWSGMMEPVIKRLGPLTGKTLLYSEIDSWEVGGQNWTAKTELMRKEFNKRRGYDPIPYFPVLTGRCMESPEITERFLWDLRRTISELIRENYYRPFTKRCNEAGLQSMCEPYVGPYESMECGSEVDIPMGEFWQDGGVIIKIASSIGNGYGRKVVAAESFTGLPVRHGGWQDDPFSMKALGDQMTCWGINRFIIHRMVHQPWLNRAPGLGLSGYGINLDRSNTWFEKGRPWFEYIARCHHLLRQGRTVADVAFFCGQNSPVIDRYGHREFNARADINKEPRLPQGYYWDSINTDLLMNHASVENGRLVLKSGASYAVLVLAFDDPLLTPELLEKINALVKEGLTVLGPPPASSPSLQNYPVCDQEIKRLVQELWSDLEGKKEIDSKVGKGRIVHGKKLATVLADLKLPPDLEAPADTEYIHRDLGDGASLYFVSNQKNAAVTGDYVFRQSGKIPELWHPDTGLIEKVKEFKEDGGRIHIPLDLEARGSVMVIFREPSMKSVAVASRTLKKTVDPIVIEGGWMLRFPQGLGAPEEVSLDHLKSWSEHEQSGVKYFSGTATYLKEVEIPAEAMQKGDVVRLDLGDVKNLAKVIVNGVDLGILWKPPFVVDISRAAKPGKNKLEIQVVNLWVNRLIGDEQISEPNGLKYSPWNAHSGSSLIYGQALPEWFKQGKPDPSGRIAFSDNHPYKKDSELLPSGLLGPVQLMFYITADY
jgi:hypothetical protein